MESEDDEHLEEDPEINKAKEEEDDYVMKDSDEEDEIIKSQKKTSNATKNEAKKTKLTEAKPVKKTLNKQSTFLSLLDQSYSIADNYFYKPLLESEWDDVKQSLSLYLNKSETNTDSLKELFDRHPNIIKAQENITNLHNM